jgi:hypothetical protein
VQANVIAVDLGRNLAVTDRALKGVIRDYLGSGVSASRDLNVSRRLGALVEASAGVRFMGVYDRDGILVASTQADLLGQDFSSRGYFASIRDKLDPVIVYLSPPFKSVNNDMVVTLGRMVPGPDAGFSGLIIATLSPAYFVDVLQNEVFTAFSQADRSTARRFGGIGLGLTICCQLVQLMGGEIGAGQRLG